MGEDEPVPAPCNLDKLWDAWVGCIVNSECFRVSEKELGGKAALKTCAKPGRMTAHCAAMHQAWTDCKFGIVQGAIDQAPVGFKNPSSIDLGLSRFNPLASLWNGKDAFKLSSNAYLRLCWKELAYRSCYLRSDG